MIVLVLGGFLLMRQASIGVLAAKNDSVSVEAPGYEPMQTEYVQMRENGACQATPAADTIELVPLP